MSEQVEAAVAAMLALPSRERRCVAMAMLVQPDEAAAVIRGLAKLEADYHAAREKCGANQETGFANGGRKRS